MKIRYDGLIRGEPEDKFLVPAIGYRSVSGIAAAAAFAIWYHFHKEGVEVSREGIQAAAFDALHMDDNIHEDIGPFLGMSYAFTVEDAP